MVAMPDTVWWAVYCLVWLAVSVLSAMDVGGIYDMLQNNRPVPGQRLSLGGGEVVFVRDPTIDHAVLPETVPTSALAALTFSGLTLLVLMELGSPLVNVVRAVATWLQATALTELLTSLGKHYMGVLRPNFYAGCGWSDETMACAPGPHIKFRKSFPSGHSAHSACFAALVTLHLLRHADLAYGKGAHKRMRALLWLALLPAPMALFVAASRVHDNWHHPADVVAGSLLGTGCAALTHVLLWERPAGASAQLDSEAEVRPLV